MKDALESSERNTHSFFQNAGFTLIEIVVVISIIGILSGIGFYSFVNYNHAQQLSLATQSLQTTLNLARSRAQSQVKPEDASCMNNSLLGYKVKLSTAPDNCPITANGCYWLVAVCGAEDVTVYDKPTIFPQEFDNFESGKTEYFFQVLNKGVKDIASTGESIKIKAYGKTNTICIYQTGRIEVSDIDSTC